MENLISKLRVPFRNCFAVTKLMALFFSLSISALALSTNYYVNDNSTVGDVFCTAVGNNVNDGLTPGAPMEIFTQVDFDGKSETVDIISLQNDCFEEQGLRAYYDQLTGRIRLFHEEEACDIVSLSIYEISGQGAPVFFEHRAENSGYFEIKSFKEFVKGIYIVTLQTANEVKTAKISIQ
jgi:hypothetical protein